MVTDAGEVSSMLNVKCCGGGGRRWGGILDTQRGRVEDGGESILNTPCRVTLAEQRAVAGARGGLLNTQC